MKNLNEFLTTYLLLEKAKGSDFLSERTELIRDQLYGDSYSIKDGANDFYDIIDEAISDEFYKGKRQGLKIVWDLYKTYLEPGMLEGFRKEEFEKMVRTHARVNFLELE